MLKNHLIKDALKLFVITLVSALVLAVANKVTAPVIAENDAKRQEMAMQEVLPDAKDFKKVDTGGLELTEKDVRIKEFYTGTAEERLVGYVVDVVTNGYGGELEIIMGVGTDGKICAVKILNSSETAGLGAKASEPEFIDQYKDKSMLLSVVKNEDADFDEIEAISGATITSEAVTRAVNAGLEAVGKRTVTTSIDISQAVNEEFEKLDEESHKQIEQVEEEKADE